MELEMFEWDELKRARNLARHRFDFDICVELFDGPMMTRFSPRSGEMRFLSVCQWRDRYLAVVWTWRAGNRRIISIRSARDDEKRAYRAILG
jgi:uncharacterized DUF497 family protein